MESCLNVANLAYQYKMTFQKDILIDLVGYRRHGHNEGDEPSFTQPLMYKKISNHPHLKEIYKNKLINIHGNGIEKLTNQYTEKWDQILEAELENPNNRKTSKKHLDLIKLNQEISNMMASGENDEAFELMHKELDMVWESLFRVLKNGGIACINIGDSTRTLDGVFKLYNSHSRILNFCISIGFESLPSIIWRKSTNSPNKFMGSGMYPVGSHVTLEHEYILVLRKGPRRTFDTPESKSNRNASAFFWEERNKWYSDTWFDVHGKLQDIEASNRNRSAAYPFELAYRLINMFSVKNDLVLDPF